MANPGLDVLDDPSGGFPVPAPIYGLRGDPELDEEVVRIIGRLQQNRTLEEG
jgi:hypothetical protein